MLKTLLLTGAAGGVGKAIRPHLKGLAEKVVLSDLVEVTDLAPHETFIKCELSNRAEVDAAVAGVDGIIHLGGISVERPFELILKGNIEGVYNLYEAARHNGKPRIIFASSNHTIGFYRRDEKLDRDSPVRPDSLYGVSKCFGENLASFYFDKFGQETLSVRIGSCTPQPTTTRMLATWLSVEDLTLLCARAFEAPRLGNAIVYGASNNAESWWDNCKASFLGWQPKDSAAEWRAELLAEIGAEDPKDPAVIYQGGGFTALPHPADK
ncbi:NAD-dependent epimerase/dehydratase family protein [Agrobacterium larrymoorei]|uniref:NAD(P)-dependent oxidoreductase n=1 Tax=Agrobacterium larrymoorei TaxID=160699 RepID=A0A4D7DUE8_9HYPH|nr:NAD(P)-dependent oxidoreductase [Agrobacterium larrymoorei]QCI98079.1 NAD(P)-dependent oxidoreductase [Agrobacterium larrymoorei]QYA06470.1 NAD(P)-dependent oxidoreductase [Agrobacterium larrymoorei]